MERLFSRVESEIVCAVDDEVRYFWNVRFKLNDGHCIAIESDWFEDKILCKKDLAKSLKGLVREFDRIIGEADCFDDEEVDEDGNNV